MPVVILCGGQGTRLREETEYRPKPMVEIGPQPILWHIMKIYGAYGLDRFVLCLGYKGWEIKQYFLRYKEMHCDFTLSMDGSPAAGDPQPGRLRELAGDLRRDRRRDRHRRAPPAWCGTTSTRPPSASPTATRWATWTSTSSCDFHWDQGRIATVTGVHPTSRYGEMRVDGAKVTEFDEKPTMAEGVVSGGFFVFQREVFDYLDDDPGLFLEQQPLRNLARDGQLSVYLHEGFWHPMDTYRDYLHLNDLWKRGDTPWKIW